MKQTFYIKNQGVKLPIWKTLTIVLALSHWNASGFVWGIFIVLAAIFWAVSIIFIINQKGVDVFEDNRGESVSNIKKSFHDRVEEKMREHKMSQNENQ